MRGGGVTTAEASGRAEFPYGGTSRAVEVADLHLEMRKNADRRGFYPRSTLRGIRTARIFQQVDVGTFQQVLRPHFEGLDQCIGDGCAF